jgi:hypothetical protein
MAGPVRGRGSCGNAIVPGGPALVYDRSIRVGKAGIRRRLVRWDPWPWEAFVVGLVRHGKVGDRLTYPAATRS